MISGFYINLDRNPERRVKIESELAKGGLTGYARFAACDGNVFGFPNPVLTNGEMGCFSSHYALLKQNEKQPHHIHHVEDDVIFAPCAKQVIDWMINTGKLKEYDIIYTDVAVPLLNDAMRAYKAFYDVIVKRDVNGGIHSSAFAVLDMRELSFASTCSFLVRAESIGKLRELFEKELQAGTQYPVDLFIRKLCQGGVIRVGCLFPFISSIPPESCLSSTMEPRFDELSALAPNIVRHSFFVGRDLATCRDLVTKFLPSPDTGDEHMRLLLDLLAYSMNRDYKKN